MNIRIDEDLDKKLDAYISTRSGFTKSGLVIDLLNAFLSGGQESIFKVARKLANSSPPKK